MSNTQSIALKIAAVLWVIWGLVHMLAGIIVIPADASAGFAAIADAVDPELLKAEYHPAVNGILDQHGWNLFWGGLVTIIGAVFIWRKNLTAIWVTGMVGGIARYRLSRICRFSRLCKFLPWYGYDVYFSFGCHFEFLGLVASSRKSSNLLIFAAFRFT